MQFQPIEYKDQSEILKGFYAYDEKGSPQKPLVLICHDWTGCNKFAQEKAKKIAECGYVGFALDMYGEGRCGSTKEEKTAFITPFMQDRLLLRKRIQAALTAAKTLPMVDTQKNSCYRFLFRWIMCPGSCSKRGRHPRGGEFPWAFKFTAIRL